MKEPLVKIELLAEHSHDMKAYKKGDVIEVPQSIAEHLIEFKRPGDGHKKGDELVADPRAKVWVKPTKSESGAVAPQSKAAAAAAKN